MRRAILWFACSALFACAVMPIWPDGNLSAQGQGHDDGSRQIVLEEFTKARPPVPQPVRPGPRRPTASVRLRTPTYLRKTPSVFTSAVASLGTMEIGVTLWRLRPSSGGDGGARVLVMENAQSR